jgi:phosphatidylinositol alpha-mannosyltransferase
MPRIPAVRPKNGGGRILKNLTALRPTDTPAEQNFPRSGAPRPLRIALVTEYYYPHAGGVAEHVQHFASHARRRGHHVDIITSNIPGARPEPHVLRLGESVTIRANGSLARATVGRGLRPAMRQLLRDGQYDIVHIHSPLIPTLPMLAADEAECAIVGTFHTYMESSIAYALGRRYFQRQLDRFHATIAVSPAARETFARYFDANWIIIPNGVDTGLFTPDAPHPGKAFTGAPTILYVGRFDPRNGLPALIDAFRLIRARRDDVQLVVVGDGPSRERYWRLAEGCPGITFAGRVEENLAGYYAASTVYACPALRGSFGITLLEAMACGTPMVCYDTPGFRNVVRHGREGLLTPPGDVPALASALGRVLDDGALAGRLAAAGRDHALTFDWSRIGDAVLGVYARLVRSDSVAA